MYSILYVRQEKCQRTRIKNRLAQNTPLTYNRVMEFQWDSNKNQSNKKKHGLSFEEASELFKLPGYLILELYDFEHSINEDRIISIGPISSGLIVVVSVERNDSDILRLISARYATQTEQKQYEAAIQGVDNE